MRRAQTERQLADGLHVVAGAGTERSKRGEVALGLAVTGDDQLSKNIVIFYSSQSLVAYPHPIEALGKRPRATTCAGISDGAIRAVTESTVSGCGQVGECGCRHRC